MPAAPSLSEILHAESDDALAERFDTVQSNEDGAIESENEDNATPDGFCVECKDQQANVYCEQCQEDFCEVCGAMIHRTGRRKLHVLKQLDTDPAAQSDDHDATVKEDPNSEEMVTAELTDDSTEMKKQQGEEDGDSPMSESFNAQGEKATTNGASFSEWIKERAKYIPLRLTLRERKYLRLLEAALNVSEYTDKIDILMYSNKSKRMVAQIKELCAILSGLVLSTDYKAGQALFEDRKFEQNGEFYEKIFEIGRRHKIMNPEKMRNEYGKLIYMLQDAQSHEIKSMLGFSAVAPIKTVYSVLESLGVVYMLDDEMVAVATKEVVSQGKTRSQMQLEIKQKERAVEYLCKAYATPECPAEVIRQCLYSIGDNHAYLRFNRDPCDRMLTYLTTMFTAKRAESDSLSLSILYGRNGARLSHSHEIQFYYVLQTLTLWREILHEMFMLWHLADSDLLSPRNSYRLKDTGQGLNRVQACPRVSKTVHGVLHRTQKSVTRWVGSSMIHLGDRNVPNALMFIDKYNQIASILNPVARALEYLESLEQQKQGGGGGKNRSSQSEKTVSYIESIYGSLEGAKKHILADFFRSAFDGSGADNFFDAGSCIDGRLTSAWNWCSSIEKKPFFNIFLLSGFVGFNGGPEGFN
ncbi:hypothetical protein EV178_002238 [Coemansia sp. RSA 1646]|nr:hypothetical protein EV178_002238 [Coemansia sp. RSA 1646]KAJ1770180.1 hypothetical protein LPJ74_003403 [Coemansia sp. RSA 1843]KAJ2217041.1 hypothetical protein EV179_000808 [Coemansia sp. RSA 487]